tara:strand:+ start:190 stop:327 length:138 start_codon:yes stop_codon:yes gene_type:complete
MRWFSGGRDSGLRPDFGSKKRININYLSTKTKIYPIKFAVMNLFN